MLVVRITENVRAVQSSYYSSCPCTDVRFWILRQMISEISIFRGDTAGIWLHICNNPRLMVGMVPIIALYKNTPPCSHLIAIWNVISTPPLALLYCSSRAPSPTHITSLLISHAKISDFSCSLAKATIKPQVKHACRRGRGQLARHTHNKSRTTKRCLGLNCGASNTNQTNTPKCWSDLSYLR
jgi:hypothetical protein